MPLPSEELLPQPRETLRPDLRLLCGIYDQLAALNARLAPQVPAEAAPLPSPPRRAQKDPTP